MSLPEEEKEIRMQPSSLSYNNNVNMDPVDSPVATPPGKPRPDPFSGGSKPRASATTSYRECLKNHAAGIGRTVTDGCGEFMPSGDTGTLEALKCAACGCHRNFHRKEAVASGDHPPPPSAAMVHPLQLPLPLPSPSMPVAAHWSPTALPVKMAFAGSGSAGTDSSSEELNFHAFGGHAPPPPPFVAKKRFRTKFSAAQKDRMQEFAEKLGWRIPREDDSEVQRFCAEVGVKRQVFKVWMHNNKSASKKPPPEEI